MGKELKHINEMEQWDQHVSNTPLLQEYPKRVLVLVGRLSPRGNDEGNDPLAIRDL